MHTSVCIYLALREPFEDTSQIIVNFIVNCIKSNVANTSLHTTIEREKKKKSANSQIENILHTLSNTISYSM